MEPISQFHFDALLNGAHLGYGPVKVGIGGKKFLSNFQSDEAKHTNTAVNIKLNAHSLPLRPGLEMAF